MPNKGFKSVTLSSIIYDVLYEEYQTRKVELAANGISSFTSFLTAALYKHIILAESSIESTKMSNEQRGQFLLLKGGYTD